MEEPQHYWLLSYGLTPSDLFTNFFQKHKLSVKEDSLPGPLRSIRTDVARVFQYLMYLIICDVIYNGVIFKFPAPKRCYIEMHQVTGEEFIKARQNGRFNDVDFLASNFTGYGIDFRVSTRYGKWVKRIYVTRKYKQIIADKTNKGESLLGSKQKIMEQYIDKVQEMFPYYTKKRRIL